MQLNISITHIAIIAHIGIYAHIVIITHITFFIIIYFMLNLYYRKRNSTDSTNEIRGVTYTITSFHNDCTITL